MVENGLRVGEPRLCHLIDGNPNTPEAAVMLQDTGDAIKVTFPISGIVGAVDGPYDRWWWPNATFDDDPDRTRYSYSPPPVMMVYDDAGPVVLVGCRATGGARQTPRAGKGVLVVDYAVLGGKNLNYGQINGMRTTNSAYRKWVGGSSIKVVTESDRLGRLQSLNLNLSQTDSIKVSDRLNMSVRRDWRALPVLDGYDVRESLVFQTLVKEPHKWRDHLDVHVGVLDLVSIAAWKNCAFQTVQVSREDDPRKTPDSTVHGERWLEVSSYLLPGDDLTDCRGRFLFSYGDMRDGAIDAWFSLRRNYGRALDYLLRILRSGHTWSAQSAIMSGVALEQLGYLINVNNNDRSHLNSRDQLPFKYALGVILEDMKALPFGQDETEEWKERCRNVYMGAKHADRTEADHLTILNTLRENLLVLRYWIAQRLGVGGDVLDSNLNQDPLRSRFVSEAESV